MLNEKLRKRKLYKERFLAALSFCRIYELKDSRRVLGARRINKYEGKKKTVKGVRRIQGLENVHC